jgi:hypothetical protein
VRASLESGKTILLARLVVLHRPVEPAGLFGRYVIFAMPLCQRNLRYLLQHASTLSWILLSVASIRFLIGCAG